jgi:Asp-tRNA(Asn)/Glu-tRNA(Gln) amidotransferase A subunit family amidase
VAELHQLSARTIVGGLAQGKFSAEELVRALNERSKRLDAGLCAWALLDETGALAAARAFDQTRARGNAVGPLGGLPVGIKDIFCTAGLTTAADSPLLSDFIPQHDAAAVARLREAGAIVLGKTVTTQFADGDPAPTRNPWNPNRTPGGSSSGSAAAVGAQLVPAALGSQTAGSVLRPASFCGVVGLKPTFGRISRRNVLPFAWSLDTVGLIVRDVPDAALLLQSLAGFDPLDDASSIGL